MKRASINKIVSSLFGSALVALVIVGALLAKAGSNLGSRLGASSHRVHVVADYGRLPLSFEPNEGQTDPRVKFLSRSDGYALFLTSTEAVLALHKPAPDAAVKGLRGDLRREALKTSGKKAERSRVAVLRVSLEGANRDPQIRGLDQLPGKANYFIGRDSKKWRTNVPTYAAVRYQGVYPGVDLIYRSSEPRRLEYDFVVSPGADPKAIGLGFAGQQGLKLDPHGDLIVHTAGGDVVERAPIAYQQINGRRRTLGAKFVLTGKHRVGFQVAAYDRRQPLVIDPALLYSTYLGGSSIDQGFAIAVDGSGNAYVTGYARSTNFPITGGAFQTTRSGNQDAFVTKLNASGSALVYSTYLGGSSFAEGQAIAVDVAGNAYVKGDTQTADFPTTVGAFRPTSSGFDNDFVTKLNTSGSALVYSTYLPHNNGGVGGGIAVDGLGNAWVTGIAGAGFPITAGAFQTTYGGSGDVYITKLDPTGSALVYSTFLGGSSVDFGSGVAVDGLGNAYVTGYTSSANFPTTAGAFQTTYTGGGNYIAFVTKLNATGSALVYSTFLGGSNVAGVQPGANGIAVDSSGNAYVTGGTGSTDFPPPPVLSRPR